MIAYVIAILMGVAIGIVASAVVNWVLPEETEDEHTGYLTGTVDRWNNAKKDYCKLFGGKCESTIYVDEALHDKNGKPIVNKELTDLYHKTFLGNNHEQEKP